MIKRTIILLAFTFAIISCDKVKATKEVKTAYIDTSKLMDESLEAKDIEIKYKDKSKEMGKKLEFEVARFKSEAANFKQNAQTNGPEWAQKKGAELSQREQELNYAQQSLLQQLQQESGVEIDSLVIDYRKIIKKYGDEKGYDYIYGSGDASPSILYAKEKYDITKEVIKLINDTYKPKGKKESDPKEKK